MEFFFLLLLSLFASSQGQLSTARIQAGWCPTVQPMATLDKSRFLGHWVETEKTPSFFDIFMRCMEVNYSDSEDGSINVGLKGTSITNVPVSLKGDGQVSENDTQGRYTVRYSTIGFPLQGTTMTILDTDYVNYAVVYSCTNSLLKNFFHLDTVSIYSKDGVLDNPTRQNIYEKLDSLKINRNGIQMVDREICPPITKDIEHKVIEPTIGEDGIAHSIENPVPVNAVEEKPKDMVVEMVKGDKKKVVETMVADESETVAKPESRDEPGVSVVKKKVVSEKVATVVKETKPVEKVKPVVKVVDKVEPVVKPKEEVKSEPVSKEKEKAVVVQPVHVTEAKVKDVVV